MSGLAMLPAAILWLLGRNSFARLLGVRVRNVLFLDGPTGRRVLATLGGSLSAALFASAMMLILFELAGAIEPSAVPTVGAVTAGMPAALAGLQAGDEILTVGGQPVKSLADVSALIDRTQGRPAAVDVLREGERHEVMLQAKHEGDRFRIGVELEERQHHVQLSFGESARRAARFPADYSRELFSSCWQALAGRRTAEFSGPVGIVQVKRRSPETGLDLLFTLPAIGAVHVAWLGLLFGLGLLFAGRGRAREPGA